MNCIFQNSESKSMFFLYNLIILGILIMTVRMLQFHRRTLIVMRKRWWMKSDVEFTGIRTLSPRFPVISCCAHSWTSLWRYPGHWASLSKTHEDKFQLSTLLPTDFLPWINIWMLFFYFCSNESTFGSF